MMYPPVTSLYYRIEYPGSFCYKKNSNVGVYFNKDEYGEPPIQTFLDLTVLDLLQQLTKPLAHGFVASYFFQPITVHDTEVLKNLIG